MINSVSIKKEADGKDLLYIKLKNGYFNRLDTLTMFSLRRYLVSTIDNHVFSIDKQMYVSENGEIFLHCIQGITQEQLKLLESILSFGELQLIPKIRSIYVEKY